VPGALLGMFEGGQMKRFSLAAAAGVVALLAPLGAAAPAQAAGPVPFTIHEQIILGPNGPVSETFTAEGPLCPSGSFVDTVLNPPPPDQAGKVTLIVRSVYTCADGSGTFNAMKELVGTPGPDGITSTGPIQLRGGTGAFTDLLGHGVDTGSIDFATGTATATDSGVVVRS
jgi:hypothetical protein